MKKKLIAGLLLLCTSVILLAGCNSGKKQSEDPENENVTSTEKRPVEKGEPDEIVCYYGCPNSNRVQRLNTQKKRVRVS